MLGDANPRRRERQRTGSRKSGSGLACLRCQRRKIRCDGVLPSCQGCRAAGVECTDGESSRLKNLPRAYIVSLKERIQWLESIVKERCPDVDIHAGPQAADAQQDVAMDMEVGLHTPMTNAPESDNGPSISSLPAVPATTSQRPALGGGNALSHEIGLVSLGASQDPRYIGPSSGYFLARVMLTRQLDERQMQTGIKDAQLPSELVEAVQGPLPLPERRLADRLCAAYFDVVHFQYPVLHTPAFYKMLDQAYESRDGDALDPVISFQVYMVMAIGAAIISSRTRARLPAESYCLSALAQFHKLNIENSLQGLQCLLLLLIFTMHSPCVRLNVWYLNYQCIAALLDLGLQRDISARSSEWSLLEQEMRTRLFWVVIMLDRMIATMMGRPIGLRDEGCELRLPQVFDENAFAVVDPSIISSPSSPMTYATHLFRLTKLNSEIKYVANSINRDTPSYAYPTIIDILDWQRSMLTQIDQWTADIPDAPDSTASNTRYMTLQCRLRGHSIRMLLLRPSPAIPKPSAEMLGQCYDSARESIRIFDELYRRDLLVYSWTTFHALVLSTLTMLYCIKAAPEPRMGVNTVMADLSAGLSVLSATGEHWSGAKRCRDILDDLGRSTIRWLGDSTRSQSSTEQTTMSTPSRLPPPLMPTETMVDALPASTMLDINNPFDDVFSGGTGMEQFDDNEFVNMDMLMRDLFQDFIPTGQFI